LVKSSFQPARLPEVTRRTNFVARLSNALQSRHSDSKIQRGAVMLSRADLAQTASPRFEGNSLVELRQMRIFTSLNRKVLTALFFLLVLALPLDTSAWMGNQTKAEQQIQDQLQQKLAAQGERFAFVTPSVGHGTIILNGTVQLYRDKLLAEELTHQAEPKTRIFNRIEVLGDIANDQELLERVAERLKYGAADLGISFPRVISEVHSGNVHLTGEIPSFAQRAVVLEIVAETPGVTAIHDELVVPDSSLDGNAMLNAAKNIYSRPGMAGYLKAGSFRSV
jgi:osmotically-inducible protein OsmY